MQTFVRLRTSELPHCKAILRDHVIGINIHYSQQFSQERQSIKLHFFLNTFKAHNQLSDIKMKAALITAWGQEPQYADTETPSVPGPDSDEVQVKVIAAGLHRLVRGRATGQHFSATKLPHILGSDGVGRTPDGKLVYFSTFWEKGSFTEYVNVKKQELVPVPEDADPIRVAGMVNPLMASWMALKARVFNPPEKFSVLVMGATSTSGTLALSVARYLGAGKVYGCARNEAAMKSMGYDGIVTLKEPAEETDFSAVQDVDVILDFVYGPATLQLFKALKPTTPTQYVQIGTVASNILELPGDLIRSKDVTIRGAAPGAYSNAAIGAELPHIVAAASKLEGGKFKVVPLKDIGTAWADMKSRYIIQIS
jgi:NADPH:quinone reductase-like Zn-dependent oxidoreductase